MKRAFINCHVVDVERGQVLRDSAVLVEDGRIAAVGGDLDLTGAEQVDLGGRYLAPGLFDCHVHLFSNLAAVQSEIKNMSEFDKAMYCIQNAETMLKSGVTFVRDVGTSNRAACELKKNVLNGKIKMSPDLLVSASAICMTGGACWGVISMEADGADECAKMARLQIREGADYVKLYSSGSILTAGMDPESPQLNVEELRACVNAAHDAGKKVCCHAQNARSIKNSILAGVDHIEHGIGIDEEAVAMMLEHGTWLDATVSGACSILEGADQLLPEVRDKAIRSETVSYESFIKAYRAGVPCACGSDAGSSFCYFDATAKEMIVMVEKCGLTPAEALEIGTLNSAKMLEVDQELGSITVGKKAHLAVFAGDPIADIRALENCCMTVKNGEILYRNF